MIDRRIVFIFALSFVELLGTAFGQTPRPKSVDPSAASNATIKVFQLENLDPTRAQNILWKVFGSGDKETGPTRFAVDQASRSVIAVGEHDALARVEALLVRLDEKKNEAMTTIPLK